MKERIATMISTRPDQARMAPFADDAELRRLGIIRVTTERFHVGPHLYANLEDAIAQAKRGRIAGNDL
jgi:hypothetical protein